MRTWAEVNLDAIKHNLEIIKSHTNSKILGIIKADAYGHGIEHVARVLADGGVYAFGVSNADEAIELRNKGFIQPILIVGVIFPEDYHRIIENEVTFSVDSLESALIISQKAKEISKTAKIHIKLDTGMGRIGFVCSDTEKVCADIKRISELPNIKIDGIFSHFSKADDEDLSYSEMQFEKFTKVCSRLEEMGIDVGIKHMANSAAIFTMPHSHMDMVRMGMVVYGHYPSDYVNKLVPNLENAMAFKTKVSHIKTLEADSYISYGGTYKALKGQKIATIAIGYADGFSRVLSDRACVLVRGKSAKVIGRICMDQCMIDVSHIDDIKIGDEVIIFGSDGNNTITVESVADLLGTINYEVVCSVTRRVPRAYIQDNKIIDTLNYLE